MEAGNGGGGEHYVVVGIPAKGQQVLLGEIDGRGRFDFAGFGWGAVIQGDHGPGVLATDAQQVFVLQAMGTGEWAAGKHDRVAGFGQRHQLVAGAYALQVGMVAGDDG